MNYRDMLGFPKKPKKKIEKRVSPKPTVPPVTELLKKEFGQLNEWSEVDTGPKRWFKKMDEEGLTEFEKSQMNEGPAYEYAKYKKDIDKAWDNTQKVVMKFSKELNKKGLRKESLTIHKKYQDSVRTFYQSFVKIMDKLG